ncbi:MAG TPA: electron transfer flavoprotein subunit alpha/FixB family protein [Phycisphaerae bacterium]|nr:electron transfer flavoprotein subunit alpha/FixB family protein [Phycisphaerae bacterium]
MHTPTETDRAQYRNVWVIAEHRDGKLKGVTFELLGAARRLADARQSEVWCVLLGSGVRALAGECIARQADVALVMDDPRLAEFVDELHADALTKLIEKHKPEIVVCGATARGRALIPRVAVLTNSGLTADCTGLDIDPETGVLLQTRPAFGGNIIATIKSVSHRPQMATVRPRVMAEPEPQTARKGRVISEPLPTAVQHAARMKVLQAITNTAEGIHLADADFIITGGRGLRGKKGFELLRRFAHLVGGAVGASRAAVDAGWIDYAHQVGQTGQTVQPKVYMACGVSGQIQHLVGMQSSDIIIAVNKDPNAPLMKLADFAVVGDVFEILPAMMDEIRRV